LFQPRKTRDGEKVKKDIASFSKVESESHFQLLESKIGDHVVFIYSSDSDALLGGFVAKNVSPELIKKEIKTNFNDPNIYSITIEVKDFYSSKIQH
jgi:hypothetical protein